MQSFSFIDINTTATGVELHKDSLVNTYWNTFKEGAAYTKILDYRMRAEETSVVRWVQGKVAGLLEPNEMSKVNINFDVL